MKASKGNTKASEQESVNSYMEKLKHPLAEVVEALRQIILQTDQHIGEEIKWNAPAFFYTGEMKSFDPKEYKRHVVVFNLAKKDCIRLIFLTGAKLNDNSGLLEGDYEDGRRLAMFCDMKDLKSREKDLQNLIRKWLKLVE